MGVCADSRVLQLRFLIDHFADQAAFGEAGGDPVAQRYFIRLAYDASVLLSQDNGVTPRQGVEGAEGVQVASKPAEPRLFPFEPLQDGAPQPFGQLSMIQGEPLQPSGRGVSRKAVPQLFQLLGRLSQTRVDGPPQPLAQFVEPLGALL